MVPDGIGPPADKTRLNHARRARLRLCHGAGRKRLSHGRHEDGEPSGPAYTLMRDTIVGLPLGR